MSDKMNNKLLKFIASILLMMCFLGCYNKEEKIHNEYIENFQNHEYEKALANAKEIFQMRKAYGEKVFLYRSSLLMVGTTEKAAGKKDDAIKTYTELLAIYKRENISSDILYEKASEHLKSLMEQSEGES